MKGHIIVAGVSRLTDVGDRYLIDEFVVHKDFDSAKKVNDIGLIRVRVDFMFTESIVEPISLPHEDLSTRHNIAVLTGWGKLAVRMSNVPLGYKSVIILTVLI